MRGKWHSPLAHGIITIMKSFLAVVSLLVLISFACTAYKSAGSQPLANDNSQTALSIPANAATAQEKTPCTLTLGGSPSINRIRLRMTPDEVLALFPGSKDDTDVKADLSRPISQFGVSGLIIRPEKYESKEKFAGINRITFALLDGRVSTFTVGYNGPEYVHVDKFVAKFVEGTSLPAGDQWEPYVGMDTQLKILKCADFEVRVFAGGQGGNLNYVSVKDLVADKELKDRRAKARAKVSPTP